MTRSLLTLIASSAVYGFAIGSVHSTTYALHNLLKFPLLLIVTSLICAPAYFVCARFLSPRLPFSDVGLLIRQMMCDASVLLASLAVVSLFLAHTIERPTAKGLGEYPLFLGLNVAFIAVSGSLALARRGGALLRRRELERWRAVSILAAWLALTLGVGAQWAWYLRPFFGVASISAEEVPFCLGTEPDFRGARSFYEALYQVVSPP